MLFTNFLLCIKTKLVVSAGQLTECLLQTHCYPIWQLIERGLALFGITTQEEEKQNDIRRSNDESCPLCLREFNYPFVATCGHAYCGICSFITKAITNNTGKCILEYWESKLRKQIDCPLCRRPIVMLLKDGLHGVYRRRKTDISKDTADGIRHYNLLYCKKPRTVRCSSLLLIIMLGII